MPLHSTHLQHAHENDIEMMPMHAIDNLIAILDARYSLSSIDYNTENYSDNESLESVENHNRLHNNNNSRTGLSTLHSHTALQDSQHGTTDEDAIHYAILTTETDIEAHQRLIPSEEQDTLEPNDKLHYFQKNMTFKNTWTILGLITMIISISMMCGIIIWGVVKLASKPSNSGECKLSPFFFTIL
ncbi:hypothetical protein BDF14DRAFT_1756077 [Spinellus fusiger]|nr:hypothetical protein BDF14DRAFT_1756077 [Spinellus fusiger]